MKKYRAYLDSKANDFHKEGRDQWNPEDQGEVVKKLRDRREQKKWRIKNVEFQKMGEQVIKSIESADAIITAAVSPQPYAALAWAGVSILLPVSCEQQRVSSLG